MKEMAKKFTTTCLPCVLALLTMIAFAPSASAQTRIVRVVTYNLGSDVGSITGPQPGLIAPWNDTNNFTAGGVLQGIGEELLNGNAQPIDVLALQETKSNAQTVTPIVDGLNIFYGVPGMYSNSTYQATSSGSTLTGNGPNALVYNTRTLRLLASLPVDPPGGTGSLGPSSGMSREVMQYKFAPAGVATNAANIFYVYVSHYKSGTGAANETARLGEATIIRNHAATNIPPIARVLYVGDFNTGVAAEGMYTTLIAPGINQAVDPVNPTGNTNLTWDGNSVVDVKTFSPTGLHYRDDYQMTTTNVYYGTTGGLALVAGTYHVFGNNGTVPYLGGLTNGANTALSNKLVTNGPVFISALQTYTNLIYASDHLPVVADYTIPMPAPRITSFSIVGTNLTLSVTNGITNAVYVVLMSTNVATAFTNWTAVASNTAATGNFTFTATNVVNKTAAQRFYLLKAR